MEMTRMTSRELAGAPPVIPAPPVRIGADPTQGVHVAVSTAAVDRVWDRFLATDGGHLLQSSSWAHVKATHGWQPLRVVATRDGHTHAGVQLLFRHRAPFGTIAYAPAGPAFDHADPRLCATVLRHVQDECRRRRVRLLVLQPPQRHQHVVLPALRHAGFRPAAEPLELYPSTTVVLDLTQPEPALLAAMRKSTRYNIRRGQRDGITVRGGDVAEFHRLLVVTGRRQGFTAPDADYLDRLHRTMASAGHARILVAEHGGEALAAALVVGFGDRVYLKRAAWSGRHRHLHPNEVLQWHVIRWAKQAGYRHYDLEGVDRAAAQPAGAALGSVTAFKIGFGGTVQESPTARIWTPHPVLRSLYGTLGQLADSRFGRRLIERVRTAR
jgi:peptidoglycan pentaglycine glycine transferase (the first glycine)